MMGAGQVDGARPGQRKQGDFYLYLNAERL